MRGPGRFRAQGPAVPGVAQSDKLDLMVTLRLYRRMAAWLALLSMVAGTLAPTLAQAIVVAHDRAAWLEVCSVSGMVWVKAEAGPASRQTDGSMPMNGAKVPACAWCMLHGDAAGLPPSVEMAAVQASHLTDRPLASYLNPSLASVWAPAQSRAPPSAA